MQTVSDRLRAYANYKGFRSVRSFEVQAGLPNAYVANARIITPRRRQQLQAAYPDLNLGWVMTGAGEMLLGDQGKEVLKWPTQAANVQNMTNSPHSVQFAGDGNTVTQSLGTLAASTGEEVPLIPTELCRASGVDIYEKYQKKEMTCIEHLPAFPKFANIDFYVPVTDESMSPEYKSGDFLAIRAMKPTEPIISGNAYILDLKDSGFLFRVLKDRNEAIECIALGDRNRYENIQIAKSEVYRVYDVKGMIRICR